MSSVSASVKTAQASASQEFKQGYKVLLAALIGAGCGLTSVCFYTNSVFVAAIDAEMPWSRGKFSLE